MEYVWIERGADGNIKGVYANPQAGYAEEALPNDNAAVVAFLAPPPPKITKVTPRQARLALYIFGLLDQVEALVKAQGGTTLISWDCATYFERSDPLIATLSAALNISSSQLDDLFQTASEL